MYDFPIKSSLQTLWLLLRDKVRWIAVCLLMVFAFWVGYRLQPAAPVAPAADTQSSGPEKVGEDKPTMWTCSMHPQIQKPGAGQCPLCGMDLIPVSGAAGAEAASMRALSITPEARALMNIQVSPVERRFVTAEVRMVGKIEYDETRLGYITARVPGRLDRLFVDYTGIEVKKGDHMVYMYSPELYSAQEELLRAKQYREQSRTSKRFDDLYESTRERLRLWDMTEEQIDQIERSGKLSDHLTIYSPMAGVVIEKKLQEGDYVQTGTRIYTIADLSYLWVKLDAYESDLPWLHYGQQVTFTTEAYPGETFIGQIAFIDPVLNEKTRTAKVRVNLPNPEGKLKPGMFVRGIVRSQVATGGRVMAPELAGKWICRMHPEVIKEQAGICDVCEMPLVSTSTLGYITAHNGERVKPLVIPVTAVLLTGTRAIVYVEDPQAKQPTFEGREIVLGPRAGDYYIVRHGLKEGELVVTNGNFKIDSEIQIRAKPSMMTPEGGGGGGGHQHGHGGPKAGTSGARTANNAAAKLPPSLRRQLHAVVTAAQQGLAAAEAGDLEKARNAFGSLRQAVDAVDYKNLPSDRHLIWKELAMLLTNDAVEGQQIADQKHLTSLVRDQLSKHLARFHRHFGDAAAPPAKQAAAELQVPATFKKQLAALWPAYLKLQAALAGDDLAGAKKAVKQFQQATSSVDMKLLTGNAHKAWMKELANLQKATQRMGTAKDLETLRAGFALLSDEMPTIITAFRLTSIGPVYQLHCPMAFDGRGATWLQRDKATRNPYYGASMLKCADWVEPLGDQSSDKGPEPKDEK